jgi:hypothetical protein
VKSSQQWALLASIVGLGVALRWSALHSGFHMDDFAQLAMLRGDYPVDRAAWDLFSFTKGASENPTLMAHGSLPWWSDPELRLTALRPLSSLLLWFDVHVLQARPVAMHVHSMLWWAAAIVAAFAALRRHASPAVALLAVALYTLDDAHTYPVAWIANRSALVSATFGFIALWSHARWREHPWPAGQWISVLASVLALAAGEYGLCAVAFIVGYELRRRQSWGERLRILAPIVVVVVIYLALHRFGGFGSQYSGIYVDPAREPLEFSATLAERFPVLLSDVLLAVPLSQALLIPSIGDSPGLAAILVVAPLVLILIVIRGRQQQVVAEHLDAWAIGGLLALIPVSASYLSGRLTVVAGVAGHLWLAMVLAHAWSRRGRRTVGTILLGVLAVALGALHLVAAPVFGYLELQGIVQYNRAGKEASLHWSLGDPATIAERRIVVLTVGDPMMLIYPPWIRRVAGDPLPQRWWVLSMAPHVHRMTRVSADVVELEVVDGAMLRGPVQRLFRPADRRPDVGDTVDLDGLVVEIVQVAPDGAPTRVRYTFDRPLDDPSMVVAIVSPRGLLRYPLGPVGSTVTVAPGAHPLTFSNPAATTSASP